MCFIALRSTSYNTERNKPVLVKARQASALCVTLLPNAMQQACWLTEQCVSYQCHGSGRVPHFSLASLTVSIQHWKFGSNLSVMNATHLSCLVQHVLLTL